jgi:adenylate kinase
LKEKYQELKETLTTNNGHFMEDQINQFIRDKLRSMPCRNLGYVLDGYPTTTEEANNLYQRKKDELVLINIFSHRRGR